MQGVVVRHGHARAEQGIEPEEEPSEEARRAEAEAHA